MQETTLPPQPFCSDEKEPWPTPSKICSIKIGIERLCVSAHPAPISRTSILKKNFPINSHLVAMSLRWLAGVQQWQGIETVYGVSICHFYYRWSKFWMRKCVAQPFKYGYQNHPMLKACSILLCSLRPLHHHQFWEDVLEPWMVRCCLLSFPQLQRQRMYVHLTRSLHAWRFERPGPSFGQTE